MWEESLSHWKAVSSWAAIIAAIAGGISVTSAFISGIVARRVSEVVQRESNERIFVAVQRAAEANAKAAEANEKAEQERLARVRIEEKLAPRSLSQSQALALRDKLKPFAGTSIAVDKLLDSADVGPLTDQVLAALTAAGWRITAVNDRLASGITASGIEIAASSESNDQICSAASMLIEGLNSHGVFAKAGAPFPIPIPNIIRMVIGTKP